MPTSKRSFGLISLHVTVCPVRRKLTSPCLPVRNKIRFARRQFISLTARAQNGGLCVEIRRTFPNVSSKENDFLLTCSWRAW